MEQEDIMSNRNKSGNKPLPIYVVVVEYHQHALEHIHSRLRRRKSLKPWSMLHFDAHPDLACPSNHIPALSCFLPREDDENNLYDLLDSHSSGIAEWILPLVLAGGLEHVHWFKPAESNQLPVGKHEYNVGARVPPSDTSPDRPEIANFLDLPSSALVRVDWKHPYYLDDASVVPTDELILPQKLQLTVSELPETSEQDCRETLEDTTLSFNGDWALDVCLDYFCCHNPFLTDVEAIDENFAEALVDVVTSTRLHSATIGDTILEPASYERELARFQTLFQQLLQETNDKSIRELRQFYESEDEAKDAVEKLLECLSACPESATLATMAMEALPNLCMPHDPKKSLDELAMSMKLHLETMSHMLQGAKKGSGDPFVITIARSTLDGFTPSSVVEKLQDQVLTTIHKIYCGCNLIETHSVTVIRPEVFASEAAEQCRFKVIFDFGEWEGATIES